MNRKKREEIERNWYYPLFHPICYIVDENGKRVATDLTDVQLELEGVDK